MTELPLACTVISKQQQGPGRFPDDSDMRFLPYSLDYLMIIIHKLTMVGKMQSTMV